MHLNIESIKRCSGLILNNVTGKQFINVARCYGEYYKRNQRNFPFCKSTKKAKINQNFHLHRKFTYKIHSLLPTHLLDDNDLLVTGNIHQGVRKFYFVISKRF